MLVDVLWSLREIAPGEKLIPGHKAAAGKATLHFGNLLFIEQCSLRVRLNSSFKPGFYGILWEMNQSI